MYNQEFNQPTKTNMEVVTTKSNIHGPSNQMTFTVEELLNRIDQVKNAGFGPEPGLVEMLLSPGARDLKRTIEEAKSSAVRARKELIDGLASCIVLYIDTHKADLKVRGSAFVTTTFINLTGKLNSINEAAITGFYETFSKSASDYELIPNLTDAIRQDLRQKALDRAVKISALSESGFFDIINNLREQVIKLSNELGER